MEWIKIQTNVHDHPKLARLTPGAGWALVKVWSWCGSHETDGAIPDATAKTLGVGTKQAAELVTAGLLERNGDGWQVHDWTDWQASKEAMTARRAAARERRARGRVQE